MEGTIIGSTDHVFPSPPDIVHGLASQTMIRYHFRPDKLFGREACMTQQIVMSVAWVYSVYSGLKL